MSDGQHRGGVADGGEAAVRSSKRPEGTLEPERHSCPPSQEDGSSSAVTSLPPLFAACCAAPAATQDRDAADGPFSAGELLGLSTNARTYGGFRFAESMAYDEARDLYVAVNAGIARDVSPNDGYISLINPDGTADTLKWIGADRSGLTLNHPLASDIEGGLLYVADINVVRWFDMPTGERRGSVVVGDALRFNDIEVGGDGTNWATQTGTGESANWRIYRIGSDGDASVVVQGAPLARPNGVALDPDLNIVVVYVNDDAALTLLLRWRTHPDRARRGRGQRRAHHPR